MVEKLSQFSCECGNTTLIWPKNSKGLIYYPSDSYESHKRDGKKHAPNARNELRGVQQ